jgi:hypothetical protein
MEHTGACADCGAAIALNDAAGICCQCGGRSLRLYAPHCCQRCGQEIGVVGRAIEWLLGDTHSCRMCPRSDGRGR